MPIPLLSLLDERREDMKVQEYKNGKWINTDTEFLVCIFDLESESPICQSHKDKKNCTVRIEPPGL